MTGGPSLGSTALVTGAAQGIGEEEFNPWIQGATM